MLRPIEPIRPSLSSKYLKERVELAGAENVVQKHDYEIDAARDLNGLAPYLQCWEQHKRRSRLPSLGDFDEVRRTVGLSGVHLVETPTADFGGFRFASFDASTRLDGHDFSGTYVADYPDGTFREAARLDYSSSLQTKAGYFSRLDFQKRHRSGKFARLVLPISDSGPAGSSKPSKSSKPSNPSKLLVIVRILEHRPAEQPILGFTGSDVRRAPVRPDDNGGQLSFDDPGAVAARQAELARDVAPAVAGEELVKRYFQSGIHEQLGDQDLLQWLLRQFVDADVARILAALLIDEFGSLPAVLAMGRERLPDFPGLTAQALLSMKVVRELATRLVKAETLHRPVVSDARQVIDYCRARMAHETVEHLRIIYLDQKNRLLRDEVFHGGGVSSVSVNPRHIVKRAILLDAQSIIMAHNHPSGDPSPSAADVEVTRDVKRAVEAVDIRLLDHLIIGRSGSVSLRTLGYLDGE